MIRVLTGLLAISVLWNFAPAAAETNPRVNQTPGIDCFNPQTSVESAVCGNEELSGLYRQTEDAYNRLKSRPGAFDIMLDLTKSRSACIRWKMKQPYVACIKQREIEALNDYKKIEAGKLPSGHSLSGDTGSSPDPTTGNGGTRAVIKQDAPRPTVGHGAKGQSI